MFNLMLTSADVLSFSPSLSSMAPARITLSVGFVSYTILIYDYFCTLETEVNDVWTCRWSFGLLLFYLNRYLPLLDLFLFLRPILSGPVPERECKIIFPMTFWLVTIGLIISQAILVLRTYAIWGCRRLILWILIPIAIILFGSMLAFTAWKTCLDYSRLKSSPGGPFPDAEKCTTVFLTVDNERRIALLILYAMVFLGEAVIVSLTMIRANQDVDKFTPRWVLQLYRNGIIYCFCMLGVTLANASVIFAASYPFKSILMPAQRTLHSIFSNRVIFLIFRHRKHNTSGGTEDTRRRPNTFAESTMAVFTSVNPVNLESGADQISWQTRAQMEWV